CETNPAAHAGWGIFGEGYFVMQSIGEIVKDSMGGLFTPISKTVKTCEKHGVEYEEIVYPRHTVGCPKCREEREVARKAEE
ncbi:hypothetical protein, partial [Halalkalicoccus sp. NIPERK01]|uniref:hypothetical protein n=1 Tax=Halalkalicoccus sp. NIPERK01 TaxID=3053469 RepID=UPI00256F01D0